MNIFDNIVAAISPRLACAREAWRQQLENMRSYDAARALYPLVTIVQTADGLAASVMERTASQIDDL